ncbi:hypothetical protein QJS66_21075 [Kocuria rhizophila]|nr:hypothetical protein QJS66_21075 [Kocuria rhizophila]
MAAAVQWSRSPAAGSRHDGRARRPAPRERGDPLLREPTRSGPAARRLARQDMTAREFLEVAHRRRRLRHPARPLPPRRSRARWRARKTCASEAVPREPGGAGVVGNGARVPGRDTIPEPGSSPRCSRACDAADDGHGALAVERATTRSCPELEVQDVLRGWRGRTCPVLGAWRIPPGSRRATHAPRICARRAWRISAGHQCAAGRGPGALRALRRFRRTPRGLRRRGTGPRRPVPAARANLADGAGRGTTVRTSVGGRTPAP